MTSALAYLNPKLTFLKFRSSIHYIYICICIYDSFRNPTRTVNARKGTNLILYLCVRSCPMNNFRDVQQQVILNRSGLPVIENCLHVVQKENGHFFRTASYSNNNVLVVFFHIHIVTVRHPMQAFSISSVANPRLTRPATRRGVPLLRVFSVFQRTISTTKLLPQIGLWPHICLISRRTMRRNGCVVGGCA